MWSSRVAHSTPVTWQHPPRVGPVPGSGEPEQTAHRAVFVCPYPAGGGQKHRLGVDSPARNPLQAERGGLAGKHQRSATAGGKGAANKRAHSSGVGGEAGSKGLQEIGHSEPRPARTAGSHVQAGAAPTPHPEP